MRLCSWQTDSRELAWAVACRAGGAQPAIRDLHGGHQVASSGAFGDGWRLPGSRDVANGVAAVAREVVVLLADVGVVALGPANDVDLEELSHGHELVEGVVHRGP